jgi:hypothetical protein
VLFRSQLLGGRQTDDSSPTYRGEPAPLALDEINRLEELKADVAE